MIYAYVVKKNQGDTGISPILDLINRYAASYGKNDFVVSIPGYMGLNVSTLTLFHQNFPKNTTGGSKQNEGFFFKGMNGLGIVSGTITRQDFLNSLYGSYRSSIVPRTDHSKVAIFFDIEKRELIKDKNIDGFIKEAKVKAILLGSSNQSKSTYIDSPAAKGEADVFMIDSTVFSTNGVKDKDNDEAATSLISNSKNESIVVTKEIQSHTNLREVANKILGL